MNDSPLSEAIKKAKLESESQNNFIPLNPFEDEPLPNVETEKNIYEGPCRECKFFSKFESNTLNSDSTNFETKSNFTFDSDSGDSVVLDDSFEMKVFYHINIKLYIKSKKGKATAFFKTEKNGERKNKTVENNKDGKSSLISTISTVFKAKKPFTADVLKTFSFSLLKSKILRI